MTDVSRASTKMRRLTADKSAASAGAAPVILYRLPSYWNRFPGYLARRFQQVCTAVITEALVKAGLTQLQWAVLCCVDDMPGIDQRRLADAVGIVPVNAGQIIDQLQTMGIVERRMNGADRRARQLHLTAHGRKLRRRLQPSNRVANDRILEPLAPHERELLLDLLVRVIEGNAVYARPGGGRRKRGSRPSPSTKSRPSSSNQT
jgi:DNA-binding MarR family transcriptional regulator